MAYRVGWNPSTRTVELVFEGQDSFPEHKAAVTALHDLVQEHDACRVLVNLHGLNARTTLSKAQQLQLSESIDPASFAHCAFAVVMPAARDCQDDWYFVTHFVKQSGIRGEPFYTVPEALHWLSTMPG